MRRRRLLPLVLVLLALSGCLSLGEPSDPSGDGPGSADDPSPTTDDAGGTADDRSQSGDGDEEPREARDVPDNPWEKEEIVVAIDDRSLYPRDYTPYLSNTTRYWMEHDERYAAYQVNYTVEPDADDPDLLIVVENALELCGDVYSEHETGGCAPLFDASTRVSETVEIEISAKLPDDAVESTMKHEFGHMLGIRHGEPPEEVMQQFRTLSPRKLPWGRDGLSVHFEIADDRWYVRDRTTEAVDAIQRQTGTELSVAEERRAADIVVEERTGTLDCGREGGDAPSADAASCVSANAEDVDDDGRWEYVVQVSSSVSRETFLWHVGRWIFAGFGVPEEDFPWAFTGEDTYEKRSTWP